MENVSFILSPTPKPFFDTLGWSHCLGQWQYPNHILYQTANAFLIISYLAPFTIHGLLYLRTCLLLGSLFFAFWGRVILCALDVVIWNTMFVVFNLIHISMMLYTLRPVRFSTEFEAVYRDVFLPLNVTRHQFKKVVACMREVQSLNPKDLYYVEHITKVDRLSLVMSGKLVVSLHGHVLHVIDSMQFLDSPEWFGVCTNDTAQVTITALEPCRILVWHRDKLKLTICDDPFLQAVFDNILGKDVVKKLLLLVPTCNGYTVACEDVIADTAKLLPPNVNQGQTGIGVLLTRQVKSRDMNVWNLAKKSSPEPDVETSV